MADGVDRIECQAAPLASRPDGSVALMISRELFAIDVVLRAAYKFTDRCHIFIQTHDTRSDQYIVVLRAKRTEDSAEDLVGEFSNELIDQRLRQHLEAQFGDVRTLIVAQAFAEGNLLSPQAEEDDYVRDPRGIGRLRP